MLGWVVLVLGIATATAAWRQHIRWSETLASLQDDLISRERAMQKVKLEAQSAAVPSESARRLQRIAPLLRQPWLPTLRAVERVTEPPVYLLSLTIEPESGAVSLEGEAPTFADVLEYAAAIDLGGSGSTAEVRSHEQLLEPNGRSSIRFRLSGKWDAR